MHVIMKLINSKNLMQYAENCDSSVLPVRAWHMLGTALVATAFHVPC